MASIQFLGATGTVTGSKYLVDSGKTRILVDCGMFQGTKKLRLLNWEPPPVPPSSVDHIVLTHAHIDHAGMLPVGVRDGFQGNIWCTPATQELCEISLMDAAHLQEEDARFANKKGFSKHKPALPLYTTQDAARAIEHLKSLDYDNEVSLSSDCRICLRDAGHILGSAIIEVTLVDEGKPIRIVFSGDLGRYNALILRDPSPMDEADYLVVESTYGDRRHEKEEAADEIAAIVNETAHRGGMLVIPAFAIGRTQTLLYVLRDLKSRGAIPDLPVFVDSPMAVRVTELFCRHMGEFDEEAQELYHANGSCPVLCPNLRFTRTPQESQELNNMRYPAIILSASGMATGGRILHHMKYRLPDPRNTILFVGYQAMGTRGQIILSGARQIKIHGEMVPIRAQIRTIDSFSAHADSSEIIRWLRTFRKAPRMTFVVHGEPSASEAMAEAIKRTLGWKTHIPEYLENVDLNGRPRKAGWGIDGKSRI
ncbi:MAG: ysh1 [Acidobacteria bacterium]|jgi:metallo-beta-lactamase family protein|nr:ysh1 [Acidobacteriota bacterium]